MPPFTINFGNPSEEDLATALGLKTGPAVTNGAMIHCFTQILSFWNQSEERRIRLQTAFLAKYTTALVDAFMDPPYLRNGVPDGDTDSRLMNTYMTAMDQMARDAVFAKFMFSDHPSAANGKHLPSFLADELAKECGVINTMRVISHRPEQVHSNVLQIARVLYTVFVYSVGDERFLPVSVQTKEKLLPVLKYWSDYYREKFESVQREDPFERSAALLSGDTSAVEEADKQKQVWAKLQVCGRAGCGATYDLKQCARCKTVLYCGRKHQREHWRGPELPHEVLCIETTF